MEVKTPLKARFANFFLKEKIYFLNRREINWKSISNCALLAIGFGICGILLLPAPKENKGSFSSERPESQETQNPPQGREPDPTQETLRQLNGAGGSRAVPQSLDHLYAPDSGGSNANEDRNSSMILARNGMDAKSQLPPGSRLSVRLYERAIVANQGMPVIGVVTRDFVHEDALAIPKGSKLFGEVSYDEGSDRAKVNWQTVQLPDGRNRQLAAIGVGLDGQVGVSGKVHSDAVKNTVGQTLTRFIGAYAEGSMQRGSMGANQGGNDNGLKNAVAETAKDRAEAWADDLKKQKSWIEVSNGTEFYAVLTANFAFRDPGATYGR